jgi:hypothetical protein
MLKEIAGISQLIQILKDDNSSYDGDIWYRGQGDFTWSLSPGLLRCKKDTPSEGTLLARFKQSAAMLINDNPKDNFDWLFLMQHYGVPTRLLDWTESPLTALYFACIEQKHDDVDGSLWSLKPTKLNETAGISTSEKNFIPSFDDQELINYSVETLASNPRNKLSPLATIATRNNPRIQSQLGVFTIHHLDQRAIEEICSNDEIIKYKIPKSAKAEIRKELKLLGINKFTLFPELSSIGEILKEGII